jgi:hypothetical protein
MLGDKSIGSLRKLGFGRFPLLQILNKLADGFLLLRSEPIDHVDKGLIRHFMPQCQCSAREYAKVAESL